MTCYVIPTLNEVENISSILESISQIENNCVIIVVDDGSDDGTQELLAKKLLTTSNLVVIQNNKGAGLGNALKQGIQKALDFSPRFIVTMDGDWSHNPSASKQLVANINGVGLLVGSRYTAGGVNHLSKYRLLISRIGAWLFSKSLKIKVSDPTSGYRVYNPEVFKKVQLKSIKSSQYNFQIELLYRISEAGFLIKEWPIEFAKRKHGVSKFKFRQVLASFKTLLQLKFNLR